MGPATRSWPSLGELCWPVFELCWPFDLGAILANLGTMWAQLAGHVRPSGGYVGLACAHFWTYVRPWAMLTDLDPQDLKNGTAKSRVLVGSTEGSAVGVAALLSYGEERTVVPQRHGLPQNAHSLDGRLVDKALVFAR